MIGGVPRSSVSSGQTGRPPVTSRAEIFAAARRLIDRDGWEKLTIRALAGELGIGATTLYHHVRDKEDLLLLLSPPWSTASSPRRPTDRPATAPLPRLPRRNVSRSAPSPSV